jgi:hypothetical protein
MEFYKWLGLLLIFLQIVYSLRPQIFDNYFCYINFDYSSYLK